MSAMLAIGVCACGGVGAAALLYLRSYLKALWRKTFPLSTFAINVVAGRLPAWWRDCRGEHHKPRRRLRSQQILGGFSTFSTMMNETVTLLRNGKIACFIGYALASIVVPVMAVACGYWLA